jgi:hypothetical protein
MCGIFCHPPDRADDLCLEVVGPVTLVRPEAAWT